MSQSQPDFIQAAKITGLTTAGIFAAPTATLRSLYVVAAVLGASGTPYALTALRSTNGALAIRSHRIDGDFRQHVAGTGITASDDKVETTAVNPQPVPLVYAIDEKASIDRESDPAWTTPRLLGAWEWHNNIRSMLLMLGVVAGAYAVTISSS